jgi:UDPglucose 6-dehydrogenase
MELSVVGAGYVGLVTAACLAHLGHHVTCLDVDHDRIARLREGELPFREPGLDELVEQGLAAGRLRFTSVPEGIHGTELVIVAVGTLDAEEEWTDSVVRAAVRQLAADRAAPRAIVIRSTLLPGTSASIAGEVEPLDPSVVIAHNPEFTREASAVTDFLGPDRIVIGVGRPGHDGPGAAAVADALRRVYAPLDAPIVVTDLTSAETIKLASNVFLSAKIAFANELARLCAATGADVSAVVDGMGMDARIVRSFLSPGPGFGGSCFPSQARALPDLARRHGVPVPLIDAIWPSNEIQADWLLDRLEELSATPLSQARVALLGLTFKAGTDDLRESPALRVGHRLLHRGATVAAWDPMALQPGVAQLSEAPAAAGATVEAAASAEAACAGADLVVLATEWPEFRLLDWPAIAPTMRGRTLADARHVVDLAAAAAAGLRVVALGVDRSAGPVEATARSLIPGRT